ncbi:MAG: VCBS repeat-containing protein [Deltaproteobacteria bacterium]|nr:VCBS repeat-containing protein [Deltaproteobacteria bacterium]
MGWIVWLSWGALPARADQPEARKDPQAYKVAVLPVEVHSPENMDFLKRGLLDMLSSRLELEGRIVVLDKGEVRKALAQAAGEIDLEKARNIGRAVGADFVVFGSLTKIGGSFSLDLKVAEVKGGKPGAAFFIQAQKMEEVVARVDDLSRSIDERILGHPLAPQVAKATPREEKREAAQRPVPAPVPAPAGPVIPAIPAAPAPAPAAMQPAAAGKEFWQSRPFSFRIKGMAIGDIDGDGRDEVALIDDRNLYLYRFEDEFKLIKKIEGRRDDLLMAVDVFDIDRDGKAEIFVSNVRDDQLSSFIVTSGSRVAADGLDWFFRVVRWGDRGQLLLGQKKGRDEGLIGPIYELGWDGKKVKELRQAKIPKGLTVDGLTPFTHEGRTDFVYIDSSDYRLKIADAKGKVLWRSRDSFGTDNRFRVKDLASEDDQGDDIAYVNVRIIPRGNELFVLRNESPVGQFFKRVRYYTKGEVQRLVWTGAMFMESWKSQEISGYLADFHFQKGPGQDQQLVVAVALPKESFFSRETNSALMISRIQ